MLVEILGAILGAFGMFAFGAAFLLAQMSWKREREYLSIIRDLQNRIHARDLTGYQKLAEAERKKLQRPRELKSMTDAEEARIEMIRKGLIDEATSEMLARTAT